MSFERAVSLFEAYDYDGALIEFIHAHQMAVSDEEKQTIENIVLQNYVFPNIDEFRENYMNNCKFLRNTDSIIEIPDFEELSLYLVPVSDSKYYVYDKKTKAFLGDNALDLDEINSTNSRCAFDSLLIDGEYDVRKLLPVLGNTKHQSVYIVLDNKQSLSEFMSYAAILSFFEKFVPNCSLFSSPDAFGTFLTESGNYIPRTIISSSGYDYHTLFSDIHSERIKRHKIRRPFLSICIPTRNRAGAAYENVNFLAELTYDEEIEIVVSNNGSSQEAYNDAYNLIKNKQETDSRIKYSYFPPAPFCSSIEQVLGMATGQFAVLLSDEDRMNADELGAALQFLYENKDKGGVLFRIVNDKGHVLYNDYNTTKDRFDSLISAFSMNYVTGICYNMELLKRDNILEKIKAKYHENNEYYLSYPHNTIFAYVSMKYMMAASGPILFRKTEMSREEEKAFYEANKNNLSYMKLNTRFRQLEGQVEIVDDFKISDDEKIGLIVEFQERIYTLMYGVYYLHSEDALEVCSWTDCCKQIYDYSIAMWKRSELRRLCHGDMNKRIEQVLEKYRDIHISDNLSMNGI